MDDAEDEKDLVVDDEVVHDAIVTDAESVEGISLTAAGLDFLTADATRCGCHLGELLEAGTDPLLLRRRQLLEGPPSGRGELDVVTVAQAMSWSGLARPRR